MKADCDRIALQVCRFGMISDSRAEGLAIILKLVEQQAFCDGVRAGRVSSYADDPSDLYERTYAAQAKAQKNAETATQARRPRETTSSQTVRAHRKRRVQATADAPVATDADGRFGGEAAESVSTPEGQMHGLAIDTSITAGESNPADRPQP